MSETLNRVELAVKSIDNAVRCLDDDGSIYFVCVSDIFYIESIEKQVFIYKKDKVYRSEF